MLPSGPIAGEGAPGLDRAVGAHAADGVVGAGEEEARPVGGELRERVAAGGWPQQRRAVGAAHDPDLALIPEAPDHRVRENDALDRSVGRVVRDEFQTRERNQRVRRARVSDCIGSSDEHVVGRGIRGCGARVDGQRERAVGVEGGAGHCDGAEVLHGHAQKERRPAQEWTRGHGRRVDEDAGREIVHQHTARQRRQVAEIVAQLDGKRHRALDAGRRERERHGGGQCAVGHELRGDGRSTEDDAALGGAVDAVDVDDDVQRLVASVRTRERLDGAERRTLADAVGAEGAGSAQGAVGVCPALAARDREAGAEERDGGELHHKTIAPAARATAAPTRRRPAREALCARE